jgi:diacylglycerol kinase family enzyme
MDPFLMLQNVHEAVIIYNPMAGRGGRRRLAQLQEAQETLRAAGIATELLPTPGPGAASEQARAAVARGAQLVIVSGGDGTVNEVVNGLAGTEVPMGLLPSGTANVLAKELELPWSIPAAARLIPTGTPRRIALGLVTSPERRDLHRYFICMGGAGPDGVMVYSVKLPQKLRLGILAYWREGFRQIVRYHFAAFRVTDGEREYAATLVVAGRSKHYGGPVKVTSEASLFEDSFEVLAATARSRWRYVRDFPLLLLGLQRRIASNYFWKTTRVLCEPLGLDPIYAQVDGEPVGKLPVEFRVVPDMLTLIIPETLSRQMRPVRARQPEMARV